MGGCDYLRDESHAGERGIFFRAAIKTNQTRRGTHQHCARRTHTTSILRKLIEEHHLGALGLDVYEDEPLVATALRSGNATTSLPAKEITALLQHPNVIFTPHNAFNSYEAVQRKSKFSADAIRYFLQHRDFHSRVQ